MAQSELCVVECDGPGCEEKFVADDWTEAHEYASLNGWSMTATEDICKECK
jgi:hypothetical protein